MGSASTARDRRPSAAPRQPDDRGLPVPARPAHCDSGRLCLRGVGPLTFTPLSLLAGLLWAAALLGFVAYAGPAGTAWLGISGWWGAVMSALIWVAFVRWLTRYEEATPRKLVAPRGSVGGARTREVTEGSGLDDGIPAAGSDDGEACFCLTIAPKQRSKYALDGEVIYVDASHAIDPRYRKIDDRVAALSPRLVEHSICQRRSI